MPDPGSRRALTAQRLARALKARLAGAPAARDGRTAGGHAACRCALALRLLIAVAAGPAPGLAMTAGAAVPGCWRVPPAMAGVPLSALWPAGLRRLGGGDG